MSDKSRRITVLALAILAYFAFSRGCQAIVAPIATLLNPTNSVSPGCTLMVVGIVAAAIVRTRCPSSWDGDGPNDGSKHANRLRRQ